MNKIILGLFITISFNALAVTDVQFKGTSLYDNRFIYYTSSNLGLDTVILRDKKTGCEFISDSVGRGITPLQPLDRCAEIANNDILQTMEKESKIKAEIQSMIDKALSDSKSN